MKKRKREHSIHSKNIKPVVVLSEEEKKLHFPELPIVPIIQVENQIIYAYSNVVLIFDLTQKTFIKQVEDHKGVIRSLDISEIGSYFLTCGDDKRILVYDAKWNIIHKITHKKKITYAYFFKKESPQETIEILFVDKYGDVYILDFQAILKQKESLNNEIDNKQKENEKDQQAEEDLSSTEEYGNAEEQRKPNLHYLYDKINFIYEEDGSPRLIKDFDEMIEDHLDKSYADNFVKNPNKKNSEDSSVLYKIDNTVTLDDVIQNLETHYRNCFTKREWIHPILTCNASVTSLFHNEKFLILGDKDEKIRIIKNKKIHKIYNFYLNHTQFPTSLILINEERFCSSGADSKLFIWNIKTGQVEDSLIFDFSLISSIVDVNTFLKRNPGAEKQKYMIHNFQFSKEHSTIFACMENIKGILIIPLKNGETPNEVYFDKTSIQYHYLPQEVLSLLLIRFEQKVKMAFTDRQQGNLHIIDMNSTKKDNQNKQEFFAKHCNSFEHNYFEKNIKIDIGLVDFWKHINKQKD